jgi:hypothetical protein
VDGCLVLTSGGRSETRNTSFPPTCAVSFTVLVLVASRSPCWSMSSSGRSWLQSKAAESKLQPVFASTRSEMTKFCVSTVTELRGYVVALLDEDWYRMPAASATILTRRSQEDIVVPAGPLGARALNQQPPLPHLHPAPRQRFEVGLDDVRYHCSWCARWRSGCYALRCSGT